MNANLYLRLLTFDWQNSESVYKYCIQAIPASSNHNLHTKQPKKLVLNVQQLKACLMDPSKISKYSGCKLPYKRDEFHYAVFAEQNWSKNNGL